MRIDEMQQEMVLKKNTTFYHPAIDRLRLILMFFMCIHLFGFPTSFGGFVRQFCGFVPIAFFILSGYLVLWDSGNRSAQIARTIKRTAIVFLVLAVVYFVMNIFYYYLRGVNVFSAFRSLRFWFNFLVMNVWQFDIGTAIWYVQSLLYAYIIIYFLEKWNLLRFDWLIAAILIVLTVCTGELAGVIRWNIAGYQYIPGNFFTRALPYILLGNFIHRNINAFRKVKRTWYRCGIACGIALMLGEVLLLAYIGKSGYYSHLLGMPVVAVSVCMLALSDTFHEQGFEAELGMSRWHINCIYYICQPVSIGVVFVLSILGEFTAGIVNYIGIITFFLCFGIAWLISYINRIFSRKKKKNHE